MKQDREMLVFIIGATVAIIIFLSFYLIPPYFEARTFNKFSDTKATYWDAVFADLRVLPEKE